MPRQAGRAWIPGLVLALVVLACVLVAGLLNETRLAFTLGVGASAPVAVAPAGATVCQGQVVVPRDGGFSALRFSAGTHGLPGPALAVSVREPGRAGAVIARGALPAGYGDIGAEPEQRVELKPAVAGGRTVAVCWRNRGAGALALFGRADAGVGGLTGARGRPIPGTARVIFERPGRSLLSQWPQVARRSAVFRAGWAGPWLSWALLVAVLAGVPALLAVALGRATEEGDEPG